MSISPLVGGLFLLMKLIRTLKMLPKFYRCWPHDNAGFLYHKGIFVLAQNLFFIDKNQVLTLKT
jgi:hypothetical protein